MAEVSTLPGHPARASAEEGADLSRAHEQGAHEHRTWNP